MEASRFLRNGSPESAHKLVLAHGSGAPMDSDFMNHVAEGAAQRGIYTVRFEFPYMHRRRLEGIKSPPNKTDILLDCWREVLRSLGHPEQWLIGGKSLGGRMASMIADEMEVAGLVCLGYPFHPPGKPERPRTEHLETLKTPTLILQGERDPFGTAEEVPTYNLSKQISMHWAPDGDHGLKPRKRSGRTEPQNIDEALDHLVAWLKTQG